MTVCTRFTRDLAILLLVSACTRAEPALSRNAQPGGAAADPEEDPTRFEAEIRAYKAADHANPPPLGGIVFVSIKPSPSGRAYMDRARETNRRIRAEIARDTLQTYVEVFTPMLGPTGQPRPELFLADSLHMTRAGYLLWRGLLAPVLH